MDFDNSKDKPPEVVRGTPPRNTATARVVETPKRQPREGVTYFRVRARGVPSFRRAGIDFGPDPKVVDASSLTLEQQIELLNTENLFVEEAGGPPPPDPKKDKPPATK